jgi:hypothetical protein
MKETLTISSETSDQHIMHHIDQSLDHKVLTVQKICLSDTAEEKREALRSNGT